MLYTQTQNASTPNTQQIMPAVFYDHIQAETTQTGAGKLNSLQISCDQSEWSSNTV